MGHFSWCESFFSCVLFRDRRGSRKYFSNHVFHFWPPQTTPSPPPPATAISNATKTNDATEMPDSSWCRVIDEAWRLMKAILNLCTTFTDLCSGLTDLLLTVVKCAVASSNGLHNGWPTRNDGLNVLLISFLYFIAPIPFKLR